MTQKFDIAFKVGSKIIYPNHGLGVIEKIERRKVSGTANSYYIIRIRKGSMTIMAPIKTAKDVGMRDVISKSDVPKIMKILKNGISEIFEPNWNKRQKTYLDKIKTGSLFEVATVYRALHKLKESKGLSFVEQQVFENAHQLVISELAEAKGVGEDKVMKLVDKALSN